MICAFKQLEFGCNCVYIRPHDVVKSYQSLVILWNLQLQFWNNFDPQLKGFTQFAHEKILNDAYMNVQYSSFFFGFRFCEIVPIQNAIIYLQYKFEILWKGYLNTWIAKLDWLVNLSDFLLAVNNKALTLFAQMRNRRLFTYYPIHLKF